MISIMKEFHIAQFGTYDIESLGDTTFPQMLAYGLRKYISCTIELFSLNECDKPYNNNSHVYAFEQFASLNKRNSFDAVILGGGEFIHFSEMEVIIDGSKTSYPAGYIWKKPLEMASIHGIPFVMNCCGVSFDFDEDERKDLRTSLISASYISVRDPYSSKRLQTAGITNCVTVADNLWYMNQMYPPKAMDTLRHELERRLNRDFSSPYILVQYGTTRDAKTLARALRGVKAHFGCRVLLMAVNYCHEDRHGMKLIEEQGSGEFEVLDQYLQPPEMIAVISGAYAFIGTSLHGNLTAASYGVPFVGIDMYPTFVSKMDGIFSMLECEDYLVPNESGIEAAVYARMNDHDTDKRISQTIGELQNRLDEHFAAIARILEETDDAG